MKTLVLALTAAAAVGCVQMTPIGPLAKSTGVPKGKPLPADDPDEVAGPPAPRPTPPAMFIVPAEVTPENSAAAADKLMAEIESDWKSTPPPPRTAEVSVIKGKGR